MNEASFIVKRDRIRNDSSLLFTKEQLLWLVNFLQNTDEGRGAWKKTIRELLKNEIPGEDDRPFIYRYSILPCMALVYVLSGNRQLGGLLRETVLFMARQSMEFWIHSAIRPYNPAAPAGGLETAHLSASMSIVMDMVVELFDEKEKKEIIQAIREKGYIPCIRWLKNNVSRSNWSAVISSQTFLAAKFLNDREGMKCAEERFVEFLGLIEADGSYGEQIDYFEYPLRSMIGVFVAMGRDRTENMIRNSGLEKSLNWMSYCYFYNTDGNNRLNDCKITFGDGDYLHKPSAEVCYFLANILGQGIGMWMIDEYYGDDYAEGFTMLLLKSIFHTREPMPLSPECLNLSLVKSFDNGLSVIRSSWKKDSIVLAMRSGGGTRTNYTHDRPDRNNILLAAYGEYFLVYPGRASYRSPLRNEWDKKTSSTSTLTFNGENQSETPLAKIKCSQQGNGMDCIISEACEAYLNKPRTVERSILFVKDKNYFLIIDRAETEASNSIELNFFFNNIDGRGTVKQKTENTYLVKRPNASLLVFFSGSEKFHVEEKSGIMHKGYSYHPGDKNEGTPGSSIKLQVNSSEKVSGIIYCTVLAPEKEGAELDLRVSSSLTGKIPRITVRGHDFEDVFYLSYGKKCEDIEGTPSADILKARYDNGKIMKILALDGGNIKELK